MRAPESQQNTFAEIAALHDWLALLASETSASDPQAVLNLGAGVVLHGSLEGFHLARVLRLADPAVVVELEADHARLHKDLLFLREQAAAGADGEELRQLSTGLLEALRRHLDRDQRTLYRPLGRLLELPQAGSKGAA